MIKLCITKDTFYRLQSLTKEGFKSEFKLYDDHAVIDVSREVMMELARSLKGNESMDDVIVKRIQENHSQGRQDAKPE